MQKRTDERCGNLTDLVKNILLGFCKINIPFAERLDVYGSVHIRADDCDVANFMLNEHCYNSRPSSPTVTSAQPVDQESEENDADLRGQKNLQKIMVKPETDNGAKQSHMAGLSQWQWSDTEPASLPLQSGSSQPFSSASQPAFVSHYSHDSITVNAAADVKRENAESAAVVNDDQLSNDGSVEILDDDFTGWVNNDYSEPAEYKPDLLKTEEQYEPDMPSGYDDFAQYDDPSASAYQYSNVPLNSYLGNQPYGGQVAKRPKLNASSVGHNVPGSSEKMCSFCQERFVSDAELSAHFQQYHQCARQPERQKRKTSLHHVDQEPASMVSVGNEESVVKMYKCRFCGQLYRSQDGLRNHENVHHSRNKRYQCNFCSQEFLTRQAAYTHRVKFHRLLIRKTQ